MAVYSNILNTSHKKVIGRKTLKNNVTLTFHLISQPYNFIIYL